MGQQVVNGLFLGSIYALFALGYTLVFGVLDILNLAHAAVFMLASFVALVLTTQLHLHIALALPLTMVLAGLLGLVLERVAFRPLRGRTDSNIAGLISSLAMATVFEAIALETWGPNLQRFPEGTLPPAFSGRIGIPLLGGSISRLQLAVIGVAVALVLLSHLAGAADAPGARGAGRGREPAGGPCPGRERGPGHRRLLLHLLGPGRRGRRALRPLLQRHRAGHGLERSSSRGWR